MRTNTTSPVYFVIHNYNTDPKFLTEISDNYIIYDVSDRPEFIQLINSKYSNVVRKQNSGHNLTSYFEFFSNPNCCGFDFVALLKGNMIGRHIDKESFLEKIKNKCYTHLYADRFITENIGTAFQVWDGMYLEYNDSWYLGSSKCKYFQDYNECLAFIFKNPIFPRYVAFSPGGCYLLHRSNFDAYPSAFWSNLKFLVSYDLFPGEAYIIERMLPLIFFRAYEVNDWMLNKDSFQSEIESRTLNQGVGYKYRESAFIKIKKRLRRLLN